MEQLELTIDRFKVIILEGPYLIRNNVSKARKAFIEKLVNPSITLYDEKGAAVLYFETSEIFTDHLIDIDYQDFKLNSISLA